MPSDDTRRRIAYGLALVALGLGMPVAWVIARIRCACGRPPRPVPALTIDGEPLDVREWLALRRLAADLEAVPADDDPGAQT